MSNAAEKHNPAEQAAAAKVLGGLISYLQVEGAIAASKFYQNAFGAAEVACVPPDEKGRTMHVHLHVNGSSLMLSDSYPEYGHPFEKPQGFSLTLQVDDIDRWWNRAVAAGAKVKMPVERMYWGDRYGQLEDPYGIIWAINERAQRAS
jgi:PhnB protein